MGKYERRFRENEIYRDVALENDVYVIYWFSCVGESDISKDLALYNTELNAFNNYLSN